MTEGSPQGGERMGAAPEWVGAVFDQGNRLREVTNYPFSNEIMVPHYDVRKESERRQWIFENMRVFLDGTVASPEGKWKPIVDNWLSELRFAANRARTEEKRLAEKKELPVAQEGPEKPELPVDPIVQKEPEKPKDFVDPKEFDREHILETEDDLKAIMAVCSSARAMEVSTGSATTYLECITLSGRGGNLDLQDTWSDFLLHKDPDKLKRVVGFLRERNIPKKVDNKGKEIGPLPPRLPSRFPLIQIYYDKLVKEAGITLIDVDPSLTNNENIEREVREGLIEDDRIGIESIDTKTALSSNLVKCLTGEGGRRGLNDYISDFMMKKEDGSEESDEVKAQGGSDSERWTAAKIATDAFLVNLYTRWEYKIHKEAKGKMYKPVPTWGGDPFRAVLEPSFLPRRIKGMYQGKDSVLLDLVDSAFRPDDLEEYFPVDSEERQEINKKLLKPSATSHLKAYARYSNALFEFFGSSRGVGIPGWDKKIMGEGLPSIVENLDQVYSSGSNVMETKEVPNLGKQVLGLMIMRIVHCKALAVAMESSRPGFAGKIGILFGDEKTRPFLEVRQFLYGPNMDARDGFFEDIAGARTRLVFDQNNIFNKDISARWKETWEILASSDQTPEGRKSAKALNTLGFVLDSLTAVSQTRKRG